MQMHRGTNITGNLLRMRQTRMIITLSTFSKPLSWDIALRQRYVTSIALKIATVIQIGSKRNA